MEILSNCATAISLSEKDEPCLAIKARTSDTLGTYTKTFLVKLCDDELQNLHSWIEDYFKMQSKELQNKKEHNRKVLEDDLSHIKAYDNTISVFVTTFVSGIANYFDFTYSPRAVATLRNSVQVCWKKDNVTLIVEFLFTFPGSTPLVIWEVRDKERQYCGEGRIGTDGSYIKDINKLVETFYNPPAEKA